MRSFLLVSVVILALAVSCDDTPAPRITYGDHHVSQALAIQYPTKIDSINNPDSSGKYLDTQLQNEARDVVIMHAILDSKTGHPSWLLPLPSKWKVISRGTPVQTSIEGPNGLNIRTGNSQNFVYSDNKDVNSWYASRDIQVRKPMAIDSIFSELLIPEAHELGMTLLTHYPLPEVTANNSAYSQQLSLSTPQYIQKTEGSDWTDREGNKVFIVMYYSEIESAECVSWGYYLEILKVEPSYYEHAKKEFIYCISNKRFSKSEIDAFNDSVADQKRAIEIRYSYYDDFHKDSTGKWVQDRDRGLDYIRRVPRRINHFGKDRTPEEIRNDSVNVNLVVNPFDGKEYMVESGFETYWINEKCQYIQSEDTLFNPNTFEAQPGLWQQAAVKVYKKSIATDRYNDYENYAQ